MRIAQNIFRGEAPRVSPELLAPGEAQEAINARLVSGNLQAWHQFGFEASLATPAPVGAIYLLKNRWLSWQGDVDAARGPVPGDATYRLFLTGPEQFDRPQFTNYALATTGSPPYPVVTRPLGVPGPDTSPVLVLGIDPTPTTFSVDVEDTGNELATAWTISKNTNVPFHQGAVSQVSDVGKPAPCYLIRYDENDPAPEVWMARNFGLGTASVVNFSCDIRFEYDEAAFSGPLRSAQFTVQATPEGSGVRCMVLDDGTTCTLAIGISSTWGAKSAPITAVTHGPLLNSQWYTVNVLTLANPDGTRTITLTLYLGSVQLATVVATNVFDTGEWCGMTNATTNDERGDIGHGEGFYTYYDNIHVVASGSTNYTPTNIATSYVFTFVNDLGQESTPSLPSDTVARPEGVSVTVTTPTNVPTGFDGNYYITTKRIYRAATGNTGTVFRFVAEIPLSTASFVDTLRDTELGEVLPSADWDMPPEDLRGIVALPNGVMAGFSKNQLCLSAQNYPHAWPVGNRLTTDTDITGIGNIDATVVVFTESNPYVAFGDDPAAYSMAKFESPQACVSKRSVSFIEGVGVVAATANGLMAVAGVGQPRNLTSALFTRDQWQALNPETIVAVVYDNVYIFAYDRGGSDGKSAYALDLKPNGFGLVQLGFHFTAGFTDPLTGSLFLVLDSISEPYNPLLSAESTSPNPNGHVIHEFNVRGSGSHMVYSYRGRLNLLGRPGAMAAMRVRATDYTNLVLKMYVDGDLLFEMAVTSDEVTIPPMDSMYETLEFELVGTARVQVVEFAEDVIELTGGAA